MNLIQVTLLLKILRSLNLKPRHLKRKKRKKKRVRRKLLQKNPNHLLDTARES